MDDNSPLLTVDGAVATIALRRPEVANRLNPGDLRAIRNHIEAVNEMARVLVLRFVSAGKYFCSGYDIGSLAGKSDEGALNFGEVMDVIEAARPVTIAAINGGVYGGATDLCLACDFRIGVPGCDMFMPAARLGLHFYRGGMARYVSRLGLNAAKRLFLTTDRIDAATMLDIGFLTEMVEPAALHARVDQLSAQLAGMAPIALLGMKQHLNALARGTLDADALARDIHRSETSADLREGAAAWKEKRQPVFSGK
ncbi:MULTISPECIES: enoyl-CoA hydratase/isomerase family protein [Cupriavidus]|uniref:Enoyl-CoA hydratase/isomerase family protein n=1 Tax=Cupriavidus campinensis TaxID=151783 RepID=A0AAE9L5K6_9BURK|nr:enoyl-CoA hydratase/isomerase family protein [Cupriavidus campinensis]TSP11816.1 enoyl-CoA hydratase/isomerase family protein [Cupriavidus campinensis]URF07559.1 enoyl-CoA hydratase/isomerase family protein [Cupriavidus campinensis]